MPRAWPAAAAPVCRVLDLARPVLPAEAEAAEQALWAALGPLCESPWPEVAWRFSRINGDGFPVEFTFSNAGPGLRYTAEVAGPEAPECARWAAAAQWSGWSPLDDSLRARVREWQRGALRWGAWVGGHHGLGAERRKLYVEAAPQACPPPELPVPPGSRFRFAGLSGDGGGWEYYFRRDLLEEADAGSVLWRLGWRECFHPLVEAIRGTLPWPVRDRGLVPTHAGFSIAPGRAFSVFTVARGLWGSDVSIRRQVLELAQRNGWDFSLYERITAPLEKAGGYLTSHGVLAWIAAPGRPVELRISVRPPACNDACPPVS